MKSNRLLAPAAALAAFIAPSAAMSAEDVAQIVAGLDTRYQAAVERNDWQAMDRLLHPDFTLVLGSGKVYSRAQLLAAARDQHITYEKQVELPNTQNVRVFGNDTAVVTALLWLKGKRREDADSFEYQLWFSDTYVRTAAGWQYAFGQASLRLPPEN